MIQTDTHRAIDAVWRIESARVIASLARIVRDVGVAEELAQDALVAALEQWPTSGIPDNPGAWLTATAKHRAIDRLRHRQLRDRKHAELGYEFELRQELSESDFDSALDDDIGDDLLRLIFTACHPRAIGRGARGAHASAARRPDDRGNRARISGHPKRRSRSESFARRERWPKHVPFEVPRGPELGERLASVLEVIYLIFNEGYTATAGDEWMRPACAKTRCVSGACSPS